MDKKTSLKRATSAGYRFQEQPAKGLTSQSSVSFNRPPATKAQHAKGGDAPTQDADFLDPVREDQLWREFLRTEWAGVKEWQKNWSFLMNYDQLGRPRKETPLPSYVPLFSNLVPNTSNQTFGNRMNTDLGRTIIHLDKLALLRGSCRKTKMDPEMLPC